jgi:hypothetical protein
MKAKLIAVRVNALEFECATADAVSVAGSLGADMSIDPLAPGETLQAATLRYVLASMNDALAMASAKHARGMLAGPPGGEWRTAWKWLAEALKNEAERIEEVARKAAREGQA